MDELKREWSRLLASTNPKQRGLEFEAFIESLLRREHFNVERKVGRANGRQVDLFASLGGSHFMFEVKWKQKAADVNDIDNLRIRLSSAAPSVVGVLVSMNGFTRAVIERVATTANRPILLLTGDELEAVLYEGLTASRLFQQKLNRLTRHQQVSLDEVAPPLSSFNSAAPPSSLHLLLPDGTSIDYWEGEGGFDPVVFTIEQADVDWVVGGGNGVTLDIELGIYDQDELLLIIQKLSHLGWVSKAGAWSISQSHISWIGLESSTLVRHLAGWTERYAGRPMHHTEQVVYADVCDNGFYSLVADVFVHEGRGVRNCRLSFQLTGIPLDLGPLQSLVETFGDVSPPFFRPRSDRAVATARTSAPHAPHAALALVVERIEGANQTTEDWVVGVVLPDPGEEFPVGSRPDLGISSEPPRTWLCRLKSWHPFSEPREYQYEVARSASTSDAYALEVMVDWANPDEYLDDDVPPMGY